MPESDRAEIRRRRNELSCPETIGEISHIPRGNRDRAPMFGGFLDPLRGLISSATFAHRVGQRLQGFAAAIEAEPGGRMYYHRATETLVAIGFKPTTRSKYMTMVCRHLGCRRGQDATGKFIEKTPVAETTEGRR
jgi:hypothetical protein